MCVSASLHFAHERFVSLIEGTRLAYPALRLGMVRVPALAAVFGENIPQAVELAMLAEEMLAAQVLHVNIPHPHTLN